MSVVEPIFIKTLALLKFRVIKKKNFMAPFYGWGSTASRLEQLRGGSLLFSTKLLVLILSTSEEWKAESTLGPPRIFNDYKWLLPDWTRAYFNLHIALLSHELLIIYQIKTSCKPSVTRLLKRPLIYCIFEAIFCSLFSCYANIMVVLAYGIPSCFS